MSNPPDRSALWTNTMHDTSDQAAKAAAALGDAQRIEAGVPFAAEGDRDFLKRKASEGQFIAQQQLGQAQHGQQLYKEQEFAVRTHNEPIEHGIREAEGQRTAQVLADTAKFVTAAAVATVAIDTFGGGGIVAGAFGGVSGGGAPATIMGLSLTNMFGGLSATPEKLGREPVLDKQLGPLVMPAVAIDDVAMASPAVAAAMAITNAAPPAAEPEKISVAPIAQPQRPAMPASMQMRHDSAMANGPTAPTWANQKPIGGDSGAS